MVLQYMNYMTHIYINRVIASEKKGASIKKNYIAENFHLSRCFDEMYYNSLNS